MRSDYNSALHDWQILAEQGDIRAQYNIGLMFFKGLGTARDNEAAIRWLMQAAAQGDARACYALGYLYQQGNSLHRDAPQAVADVLQWPAKVLPTMSSDQDDASA